MEGIYIDSAESKINKIGLTLTLKNISTSGATLVFTQNSDQGKPTGEIEFGDDFTIEKLENGIWIQAPFVIEGEFGFNSIARLNQSNGTTEQNLKWEWIYGSLQLGDYRIKKSVLDFRGPANFDKYTIYAQFKLN